MCESENSFSIVMLAGHRKQPVEKIKHSLETDIYFRLLAELVNNKWSPWVALWTYADEDASFELKGVHVRCVSDWQQIAGNHLCDILFVRADRELFLPVLKSGIARRTVFYGASSRGIPRHWKRFHAILVDDESHIPIVRQFYPQAYITPFLKTAAPETFFPIQHTQKEYDICIAGKFVEGMPNTFEDIKAVLDKCSGLRIVICGETDESFIQQLPDSDNNVTLTGRVSRQQLNTIFNTSKLALLTEARVDAAPRVLLEYMASGVPILANRKLMSVKKFMLSGCGEMAETPEFPVVVSRMLQDIHAYNPRAVFEEHFTPPKVAADLATHIHNVMKMPESPPRPSWKGRFCRILRARLEDYT